MHHNHGNSVQHLKKNLLEVANQTSSSVITKTAPWNKQDLHNNSGRPLMSSIEHCSKSIVPDPMQSSEKLSSPKIGSHRMNTKQSTVQYPQHRVVNTSLGEVFPKLQTQVSTLSSCRYLANNPNGSCENAHAIDNMDAPEIGKPGYARSTEHRRSMHNAGTRFTNQMLRRSLPQQAGKIKNPLSIFFFSQ